MLQPTSDLRPKPEDVRSLGDDLSRELGFSVRLVGEPEHAGRGVTWWEVIRVWLPASAVGGAAVVVGTCCTRKLARPILGAAAVEELSLRPASSPWLAEGALAMRRASSR